MRNVAVLSHIADIDGVGAAALVRMRYRMPLSHIFFTGHDRSEIEKAGSELRALSDSGVMLFITDLNPSADTLDLYGSIIKRVKDHGGSVVWLDHHFWSGEAAKKIAGACDVAVFGENKEMCATQLVHRFLKLDSGFANEFADNVHYIDLFIRTRNRRYNARSDEYKLAIAFYLMNGSHKAQQNRLRRLAAVISSGRFTSSAIHRDALRFRKINDERLKLLFNNMIYLSKNVVLGFSKQVDSTDAGHGMLARSGADIAILVKTQTGHCSIRSVKADTVPLARALGGGGHPHASGFSVDAKSYRFFKTKADKERFIAAVEVKAKNLDLL